MPQKNACDGAFDGIDRSHPHLLPVLTLLPHVDPYVFYGPRGGRLKPDTVRNCLVSDVIMPIAHRFPVTDDEKSFKDGRLHSFRHYFCSTCANSGVPEMVTMQWLGHADSEMVRHYYHLLDKEDQRQMRRLNFLGEAGQQRPGSNDTA
jgi:integrase